MANKNSDELVLTKRQAANMNRNNRRISGNINALLDDMSTRTYGTKPSDRIDSLKKDFSTLIKDEISDISKASDGDTTGFITKIFSERNKRTMTTMKNLEDIFNTQEGQLEAFLQDAYRNRLVKQCDLHEVTSQLVELREAIGITRDAIVSSDTIDGHINRIIKIGDATDTNNDNDEKTNYMPIIEQMEKKYKIHEKIKNFIVPKTLEFGEYYVYHIPYAKIFEDFMKTKEEKGHALSMFRESVENPDSLYDVLNKKNALNSIYTTITENVNFDMKPNANKQAPKQSALKDGINNILKNITVVNQPIPLVCLEEGVDSVNEYFTEFVESSVNEADDKSISFDKVMKDVIDPGVYSDKSMKYGKKSNKKNGGTKFNDIKDCYIKLIDPIHLLPIEIMSEPIGYCYIQEEDITVINGMSSSSVYFNQFEVGPGAETNIIDSIAETIVSAFDKKFLENNMKFKKIIVEALRYYDLNTHKIKFQFIPKEYITTFKVNEDEEDHGTSIIEPSLFYAKLYLMLLLFKIMSIVLNSNDMKVNYIKSGLEMNVSNKIQEIARKKQQRQITLTDMFSYTTLINKIGQGSEMYIPVGKSGERPMETEILSGQDIPLHNDLMEMLKKAYITGTGVPDVLMNYINEADFAKTLELANNRFHGRVVSYQLDFNQPITEMYRNILKWTTTMPQSIIDEVEFNFVQPKYSNANITNEMINNHNGLQDFIIQLYYGEDATSTPEKAAAVSIFKKEFAKSRLPMINWAEVEEWHKDSIVNGKAEAMNPDTPNNEE